MALPLKRSGSYYLSSYTDSDSWISGMAFGKNLWNHAYNSAYNYYRAFNGGTPADYAYNIYMEPVATICKQ